MVGLIRRAGPFLTSWLIIPGTMFIKSIDASTHVKDAILLCELLVKLNFEFIINYNLLFYAPSPSKLCITIINL
jgi:hypothetical protein